MISIKDILISSGNYIVESKQSIINLGIPEIIAKLFYEKFGNNAFIIARWYYQYYSAGYKGKKDWFLQAHVKFSESLDITNYIQLYNATFKGESEYINVLKSINKYDPEQDKEDNIIYDDEFFKENRKLFRIEIEKKLFDQVFFKGYNLTKNIISGKLKNLAEYENLNFNDAYIKYDEKRIFQELAPIKKYSSGYKWINVGSRCDVIGKLMKNCGSTGVMSWDKDRTMYALFDSNNIPHAIVTHSPNENRISGDEGAASSTVKDEYAKYIIDLCEILNANFDFQKSSSKFLKIFFMLGGKVKKLQKLEKYSDELYNQYYKFIFNDTQYITDAHSVVSLEDIKRANTAIKNKQIKLNINRRNIIKNIFNQGNSPIFSQFGIVYTWIGNLNKI